MNNQMHRDDSFKNRLSSFLFHQGGLDISTIMQVKPNVFTVKMDNEKGYILKGKSSKRVIDQQWNLFEKISSDIVCKYAEFPNEKRVLNGFGLNWTVTPYIDGNALDFKSHRDRFDALKTICQFHKQATGIQILNPTIKEPLYVKWYKRISKLRQTKHLMERYGFKYLYNDIDRFTKERLTIFKELDWYRIEKSAVDEWKWVHGDVASHNFLRDNNNKVHLIDFDLLSLSPPLYDYIQLGQRFLPYIDWDLDQLLTYSLWEEVEDLRTWLLGITIPSDVIREWWYFTLGNRTAQQFQSYLQKLAGDWLRRIQFVEEVDIILK